MKNANAVDFNNPESLAEALAATDMPVEKPAKEKKEPKPRTIKVSFTATEDIAAGTVVEFDYIVPKGAGTRGQVAGIPLEEMNDDQLKIEYRNANSVAYKTKKAGRDSSKADARVEAVVAEMDKRGLKPNARTAAPVDVNTIASLIKSGKLNIDELQSLLDSAE